LLGGYDEQVTHTSLSLDFLDTAPLITGFAAYKKNRAASPPTS